MAHRKTVRHFHEVGNLHELTFSCYRRMPLLTNDSWREKLGRPVAVLSDEGAELKSGMELYREELKPGSPKPPHLHDIKHKAAAYLKKELHKTDRWAEFVKRLSNTKVAVITGRPTASYVECSSRWPSETQLATG